jgi:hypothetical protein
MWLDLKARGGAIAIMLAIMFFSCVAISALAIDFARLWSLRNELQTSADAGAEAGAIQLFACCPPHNPAAAPDTARAYAKRNKAMQDTVTVDSVIVGDWDDALQTFTTPGINQDGIKVVVSRQMKGLIMSGLGVPLPRLKARATGWARAPVATSGCMKPWAIPYVTLMYRLNLKRGIVPANSWPNLTRPFSQQFDIPALNSMTDAERTFNLKLGSGTFGDSVTQSMPGNYQAVELGKLWDKATQTYPNPGPQSGGTAYRNNINGTTCYGLSVGDSLESEPGNKVGPTIQGVTGSPAGPCPTLRGETDNTKSNSSAFGDCLDAGGQNPQIKAAFYVCGSGCNGRTTVGVNLLGSFTLKKVYPADCKKSDPYACDKAEIQGLFNPIQDNGPVGGGSTTLQKPILVR